MKHLKRIPRWLISTVFLVLILVFLALYVRSLEWHVLTDLSVNWTRFALSIVVGLAFLYVGAYIWRVILRALGADQLPGYRITTAVYAKAWMGRYIPGTVTWIAAKVYLASTWGISKSRLSVASLLEAGSQVAAFTFTAFLLLGVGHRLDTISQSAQIGLIILGLAVLIILIPAVFNRVLALLFRLKGKRAMSDELRINNAAVGRAFGLYIINGLLFGAGTFLVAWSLVPDLALGDLGYIIGASCLATVAGMAAPFAPSGIGIKDGLLLAFLTRIMPAETALAVTILARLWSVLIDILFLSLAQAAVRKQSQVAHA